MMEPEVWYLVLCEDVRPDPNDYERLNIFGLTTTIRSTLSPPFPVVHPLLCALVLLTGGQGHGEFGLRIRQDQTGRVVFRSLPRQVRFVGDSTAVLGALFRIRRCGFPAPGLYWVEVLFEGTVLARQKLRLSQ
jgi:hypothetical protein